MPLNVGPPSAGWPDRTPSGRTSSGNWGLADSLRRRYFCGTRGSFSNPAIGEYPSTCKDNRIYLFIFCWPKEGPLVLAADQSEDSYRSGIVQGVIGALEQSETQITLIFSLQRHPLVTVLELTVNGSALDIPRCRPSSKCRNERDIEWIMNPPARSRFLGRNSLPRWHIAGGNHGITDAR